MMHIIAGGFVDLMDRFIWDIYARIMWIEKKYKPDFKVSFAQD